MLRLGQGGTVQRVAVPKADPSKFKSSGDGGVLSFSSIAVRGNRDTVLKPTAKAFSTGKATAPFCPPEDTKPPLQMAPDTPGTAGAMKAGGMAAAKSGVRAAAKTALKRPPPRDGDDCKVEEAEALAQQYEGNWSSAMGAGTENGDEEPPMKRPKAKAIQMPLQGKSCSITSSVTDPEAAQAKAEKEAAEVTATLKAEAIGKVIAIKPEWASRCTVEPARPGQPQRVTISMAEAAIGDAGMTEWCEWIEKRLSAERPGGASVTTNRNRFKASTIDFSENQLTAAGVKVLCATLEKLGVRCEILRLTGNGIGNEGMRCITKFLTCSSTAMALELHVSRNPRLTGEGIKWLLGSLAMHPAYPIWSNESRRYIPLWVRAENAKVKGDAGYDVLQTSCNSLSCTVCLGETSADVKCGPRQCVNVGCCDEMKHNCVAHFCSWDAPEGALALPAPGAHARPAFSAAGKGAPRAPPSGVEEVLREEPRVIYEDDDIAVVLKPTGWSCLPQPKGVNPTWAKLKPLQRRRQVGELMTQTVSPPLQAWLLLHFGAETDCDAARDQASDRGIAHRLDVDASGPLLVGKTLKGFEHARKQIAGGLSKDYLALVHGSFATERGECVAPIDTSTYTSTKRVRVNPAGQPATTVWEAIAEYEALDTKERYTLVQCRMVTLRTHQLRAHMQHLGHPLVGDVLYGDGETPSFCPRLFMHKSRIGFFNLQGQACYETCSIQTAPDLWRALSKLRKVGGMAMMGCGAPGV